MGIVKTNGEVIIESNYSVLFESESDLIAAQIQRGGEMGFLNWEGAWEIKPKFYNAQAFSEGLSGITETYGGKSGFIDEGGNFLIDPQFASVAPFSSGFACVQSTDGDMYYVDKSGKRVSDKFTACGFVKEGRAPVYIGGRLTINLIAKGGYWTYLDENFKIMKGFKFKSADSFTGGLARVFKGSTDVDMADMGYIDRQLNYVWKPTR